MNGQIIDHNKFIDKEVMIIARPTSKQKIATSPQERKINQICAKCGLGNGKKFYASRSPMNEYFGKMNWCNDCLEELYQENYQRYEDNYKAMESVCQVVNIPFEDEIFSVAKNRIETKNTPIYAGYFIGYNSAFGKKFGTYYMDSSKFNNMVENQSEEDIEDLNIDTDLLFFWGTGFSPDEYEFLEWDLEEWMKTHKCDTRSEKTLLKEICIKELELRNARSTKDATKDILKELQDLMKTAAVDPAKANVASAGKAMDAFGVWIKDIEKSKPAEWHNEQMRYKDMDGLSKYIEQYITRPIKNFITGSRDFDVDIEELE